MLNFSRSTQLRGDIESVDTWGVTLVQWHADEEQIRRLRAEALEKFNREALFAGPQEMIARLGVMRMAERGI